MSNSPGPAVRRRWRYYTTSTGAAPVRTFLEELEREDGTAVRAAMNDVRVRGLVAARHLRGDVYEVRAQRAGRAWRILFAMEGRRSQVLLAVSAFEKKTARTPPAELRVAESRLLDWRRRPRR